MKRIYLITALLFAITGTNLANNILVSNANITGQNTTTHTSVISFDVTWENSWRTSTNENNYDGAWVFVKFRKNGTNDWRHATFNVSGNTPGAGATIAVPADGKGAFVYKNSNGIGTAAFTGNSLVWNYGVDGLLDNETVEIRVFALEMVYVTTGSFYLGSGGAEAFTFRDGSTSAPYLVNSGAISTGTTAGSLNFNSSGTGTSIPASFGTGYNAFWLMKYECSQQQWADFLNHLDLARATILNTSGTMTGTHPNFTPASPDRAVTGVGFLSNGALADWSGLRPFTELEYEKASRGYNTPSLPNEYAWGNTSLSQLTGTTDPNTSMEAVSTPVAANGALGSFGSPTRVGIFARNTGSTRALSGATYYGIMNMGDNVAEITVFAGSVEGRNISASVHGDGYLAANAYSNIPSWLANNAFGFRGGSYNSTPDRGRLSDRANANFYLSYPSDYYPAGQGIRLARTAF